MGTKCTQHADAQGSAMPRLGATQEGWAEGALGIVVLALSMIGPYAVCVPPASAQSTIGSQSASSGLRGMLTLSPAIPGTAEYELQQKAAHAEGLLGELDAITSARVSFSTPSDEGRDLRATVRLELAGDDGWSRQLCETIVALLVHVEPQLAREAVLIIDVRGRTLFRRGRNVMPVAAVGESDPTHTSPALSRGTVIGIGAALGLIGVLCWWLLAGRSGGRTRAEPGTPPGRWAFLSEVQPARLQEVLGAARPEIIGAIAAQLDERGAARLRRVIRASGNEVLLPPERDMDPDVEAALLSRIRKMLAPTD